MSTRIDYYKVAPEAVKAMLELEKLVNQCGLEKSLIELVKLRASQINGCAYCIDLHVADAVKSGESQRRLHAVSVWRDTPFFTPREQAALAWTEAVTLISTTHAPDEIYEQVTQNFNEKEVVNLTMAIITINSWNRLSISFGKSPKI